MADYNSTHTGANIDEAVTNALASNVGKDLIASSETDLNNTVAAGFYRTLAGTTANQPISEDAAVIVAPINSSAMVCTQLWMSRLNDAIYYRRQAIGGTWQAWVKLFHTGNMQTTTANGIGVVKLMKNTSGGAIADGASVAGSTISSVKFDNTGALTVIAVASGTWQSVNGASLASNESGYFVRTA